MIRVKLIVAADEPAIFFASVRDAEAWMEAIDVEDGVYGPAFGPNGEPYAISTDGRRVIIQETGGAPQPEELKALLMRYFADSDEPPNDDISLSALLERCTPSYGRSDSGGSLASRLRLLAGGLLGRIKR